MQERFRIISGGYGGGMVTAQIELVKSLPYGRAVILCSDGDLDFYISRGIQPSQILTSSELNEASKHCGHEFAITDLQ